MERGHQTGTNTKQLFFADLRSISYIFTFDVYITTDSLERGARNMAGLRHPQRDPAPLLLRF